MTNFFYFLNPCRIKSLFSLLSFYISSYKLSVVKKFPYKAHGEVLFGASCALESSNFSGVRPMSSGELTSPLPGSRTVG